MRREPPKDQAGLPLSLTQIHVRFSVAFSSHHQVAEFDRVGSLCRSTWLCPAREEDTSVAGRDGCSSWKQGPAFCSCDMTTPCAEGRVCRFRCVFHFHIHQVTLRLDGLTSFWSLCFMYHSSPIPQEGSDIPHPGAAKPPSCT